MRGEKKSIEIKVLYLEIYLASVAADVSTDRRVPNASLNKISFQGRFSQSSLRRSGEQAGKICLTAVSCEALLILPSLGNRPNEADTHRLARVRDFLTERLSMAHYCPECGLLCHCKGDIDDLALRESDNCNHCDCPICRKPKGLCDCDPYDFLDEED